MSELTGIERMQRILRRQPVDRIGLYEHFWDDTQKHWASQGKVGVSEDLASHFGFDMSECWCFNLIADLDHVPQTVEETAETILIRDGNGALLRRHKLHDTSPEHVGYQVTDREGWEEHIKPRLTADRRRIDFAAYRRAKEEARRHQRFFVWSGVNVFESMHPVCGHENLLAGMALDPEWIQDMVASYARLLLELQEILFAEEGQPDGVWYYDDMGFKEHPMFSLDMYREIIQPGHKQTIAANHARGLPVIMHSFGFVEPLLPAMVESGIDCLQVIEIKAGMDPLRIKRNFGDRLSLMGGIDVRSIYTNDRAVIERELQAKVRALMPGFGFTLHSDHSIPKTVDYETYRWFIQRGLELGRY